MRVTSCVCIGLLAAATSINSFDLQDVTTPAATPLALVTAASVTIPQAATRVNVAGRTIMPGMINAHGHVTDVRGLKASPEFYTPSTSSISSPSTRATASRPSSASAAMVRQVFRFATRRRRVLRGSLSQGP